MNEEELEKHKELMIGYKKYIAYNKAYEEAGQMTAEQIKQHWIDFEKLLEENPYIKEMWEKHGGLPP